MPTVPACCSPCCPGNQLCPRALDHVQPGSPPRGPLPLGGTRGWGRGCHCFPTSSRLVSRLLRETSRELLGGRGLTHLTSDGKRFVETPACPTLPTPLARESRLKCPGPVGHEAQGFAPPTPLPVRPALRALAMRPPVLGQPRRAGPAASPHSPEIQGPSGRNFERTLLRVSGPNVPGGEPR